MESHIFITDAELVELLNRVASDAGCEIFVTESPADPYKAAGAFEPGLAGRELRIELGFLADGEKLLSKPAKEIYREDRLGLVSVNPGWKSKDPTVLLETTFAADPSDQARAIFKSLRKILAQMARKGTRVINEKSGKATIDNSTYWTSSAAKVGKTWQQAENSWVKFEPLIREH